MPRYAALIYGPETTPETVSEAEWAATMKLYNDFGETAGAAECLLAEKRWKVRPLPSPCM